VIKKTVVFPFVEAGMGHIMPMRAVSEAFKKKYGSEYNVIETYFFRDQNNNNAPNVEVDLIKQVINHNKLKGFGALQFMVMGLVGQKITLSYLFKKRYGYAFDTSVNYIKALNADVIFHTHFSTLYYANEAKERNLINAKNIGYCPDPIIGKQWDNRFDTMIVSSYNGIEKASKSRIFNNKNVIYAPFTISQEVKKYSENKAYYKEILGIEKDSFTILLCDGAYGAGNIEKNLHYLLNSKLAMSIIVVCGKNETLFNRLKRIDPPKHIHLLVYGFTKEMLLLNAASDIFIGKSGASNLAEAAYFNLPTLITTTATNIEVWIADYYINEIKNAVRVKSTKKMVSIVESFIKDRTLMTPYIEASKKARRTDGPDIIADYIKKELDSITKEK